MKLWHILLFLFIFGFGTECVNELVILPDITVPSSNINGPDEAEIQDITEEATSTGLNPLFTFFMIQMFLRALLAGALAILSILPWFCGLLGAFGVPLWMSVPIGTIFQGPIWYVTLNSGYQLFTGHQEKGME
jgi:hypothetical protein